MATVFSRTRLPSLRESIQSVAALRLKALGGGRDTSQLEQKEAEGAW
jgi:hypothetical protein